MQMQMQEMCYKRSVCETRDGEKKKTQNNAFDDYLTYQRV